MEVTLSLKHIDPQAPRYIIKKDVSKDQLTETLLYNSDWPRIPFDKCWNIKKMISKQPEGRPLSRIKLVDRALKAVATASEESPFSTVIQQLNKEDWKELMK